MLLYGFIGLVKKLSDSNSLTGNFHAIRVANKEFMAMEVHARQLKIKKTQSKIKKTINNHKQKKSLKVMVFIFYAYNTAMATYHSLCGQI